MRAIAIVLLLAACASGPPPSRQQSGTGIALPPPAYVDYCARHQEDTGCPRI
jgi:hypothetical protein